MRRYTFTLKDETEYEVPIESESEEKAEEILNKMSEKQIRKHAKVSSKKVTLQVMGVKKERIAEKIAVEVTKEQDKE